MRAVSIVAVLGVLASARLAAQAPAPAQAPPAVPAPASNRATRANWLSDRLPLRVGDLVTVVVDEQATAREKTDKTANDSRSQNASLNPNLGENVRLGPVKGFGTGLNAQSRTGGQITRQGDLAAVITVRVVELQPNGVAKVAGTKQVVVDGRKQDVTLTGLIRAEDVSYANTVLSSRVADATITYKGRKIGPNTGIIGKILSILWP
ncbi:MAG: flagellar basal body L-ring protein FlgH [Gemmatimonadota bacterium]